MEYPQTLTSEDKLSPGFAHGSATLAFWGPIVVGIALILGACSVSQENAGLTGLRLLATSECSAPCFHDITPGMTSEASARAVIASDQGFRACQDHDLTSEGGVRWTACEDALIVYADSSVDAITIMPAPFHMRDLVDRYGTPQLVLVQRVSSPDQGNRSGALVYYAEVRLQANIGEAAGSSVLVTEDSIVESLTFNSPARDTLVRQGGLQAWHGYGTYLQGQ